MPKLRKPIKSLRSPHGIVTDSSFEHFVCFYGTPPPKYEAKLNANAMDSI